MKSISNQSVPIATAVGLGLVMFVLVVNMLVSQANTRKLIENEQRVVHTQRVLTTLEEVLARITEAETSERGFLITGDADYYRAYQAAVDRTAKVLETLSAFATDISERPIQIRELRDRVQSRFDELNRAIAAANSQGFDAAKLSVSTNQGRRLMNEMRSSATCSGKSGKRWIVVRRNLSTAPTSPSLTTWSDRCWVSAWSDSPSSFSAAN